MFSKFSDESQKCLLLAKNEMMKLKHPYVGSEHLLLAILSYKNSVSKKLFKYDISYEKFYNEVINIIGVGSNRSQWFLFTPLLKRIIQNAVFDSKEKKEKCVTVEQLFLSLLEEGEGVAIRLLLGMNIDIDYLYKEFSSNIIIKKNKREKKLLLSDFSVDFNKKVLSNELDPVVNRDDEVNRVIEILCRRTKNNPLLVGEAGVGKTAIVEELSRRIVEGRVPKFLQNKVILSVSVASLISGTKYRGEFEERINKIINEVENEENIILFIDEVHTIVGAGGAEGAIDASNILKPSLARGKIKIIGATTIDEYVKFIEKDKALDRRFQKIYVNEPNILKTKDMILSLRDIYESFHGVTISDNIIDYIVDMSDKYIQNRKNPDKSIDIMDEVCAKAVISNSINNLVYQKNTQLKRILKEKNNAVKDQNFVKATELKNKQCKIESEINSSIGINNYYDKIIITKDMVNRVIEDKTGIPIYGINKDNKVLIKKLDSILHKKVVGQNNVVDYVINCTKKITYGFRKNNPYSFLFVGPTGTGKTLLVKEFAKTMYGENNFIRIDMSEFKEEYSISKLLGSAPGYVGFDDNVSIFEKVRNHPHCVILLDEIEKASKSVIKLFLQILDEGTIHDSLGRNISFKNAIIFMTSNLGFHTGTIGFKDTDNVNQSLKEFFSVEFLNRIDKVFVFNNLDRKSIKRIVKLKLDKIKDSYKNININFSNELVEQIIDKCNYDLYGARRIDKIIDDEVMNTVIGNIIDGKKLVTL